MRICPRRREFIAGLGGAAAWPLAARAQQPTIPVIGFLHSGSPGAIKGAIAEFQEGLKEAGYVGSERCYRVPLGELAKRATADAR
jgi:putative ABC transport system substrate-binding protein